VTQIDAYVTPEIFQLADLLNAPVKGRFYPQQLRKAPNPNEPGINT